MRLSDIDRIKFKRIRDSQVRSDAYAEICPCWACQIIDEPIFGSCLIELGWPVRRGVQIKRPVSEILRGKLIG